MGLLIGSLFVKVFLIFVRLFLFQFLRPFVPYYVLKQFVLLGLAFHFARVSRYRRITHIWHFLDHLKEITLVNQKLLPLLCKVHFSCVCGHKSVEESVEVA